MGIYTTINTCLDILKKRNKFKLEDLSVHLDYVSDSKAVEDVILRNLDSVNLRKALMQIPEKYRVLLYMFYFEEMKISSIALIINENENTVKTKLRRGKNALKRILEKSEGI